jgi:hypothetical protein
MSDQHARLGAAQRDAASLAGFSFTPAILTRSASQNYLCDYFIYDYVYAVITNERSSKWFGIKVWRPFSLV